MSETDLAAGLRRARAITHRESNHLARAAERLPTAQQRAFFEVCYASMRIADDLVDEKFLTLPAAERREQRDAAQRELADWLQRVERCARGEYRPERGDDEAELFVALNSLLGRAELGARPWRLLARSLRRDLQERPLESWADYLEYCQGACVAPASVFLYLLGARFAPDGASRYALSVPPDELARDLAIYAYLVHMLRDLREDAAVHPQLVQLPRSWLRQCGLTIGQLDQPGAAPALLPVVLRLRGHALARREAALRALERAETLLPDAEASALRHVLELYDEAAREIGVLDRSAKIATA